MVGKMSLGSAEKSGIEEFLESLASGTPSPAAGTAVAITGAMAAALTSMVCRATVERRRFAHLTERIAPILKEADILGKEFSELAEADAVAVSNLMTAIRTEMRPSKSGTGAPQIPHAPSVSPVQTPGEAQGFREKITKAAEIGLRTCQACFKVMELQASIKDICNPNALDDLRAGSVLGRATIDAAALICRADLALISDDLFKEQALAALGAVQKQADKLILAGA